MKLPRSNKTKHVHDMITRLFAMWFTVGVSWAFAWCHGCNAEIQFRKWGYDPPTEYVVPNLTALFGPSSWVYYFPVIFGFLAAFVTWKARKEKEIIWCLIVVMLGIMVVFLAMFHLAMEIPEAVMGSGFS